MCSTAPAVCHVCVSGHDEGGYARDPTIVRSDVEQYRADDCVELEVLAVCCMGDVQVPQEEALHGGSQFMLDCVDYLSEQGEDVGCRLSESLGW